MKLLRVGFKGKEKPAAIDKEGKIRDISSHINDLNPGNLNFETISKIQSADLSNLPELSSSERIGSCIVNPGKFVAIGLNYSDHAAETGAAVPTEPIMFMKAPSSICGPNDDVEIVTGSKKLDWEVELGIVIGKDAKHISENQSQDHILGYCLVNDVSEREWQIEKMGQWVKGKSHDTYGPIGPYLGGYIGIGVWTNRPSSSFTAGLIFGFTLGTFLGILVAIVLLVLAFSTSVLAGGNGGLVIAGAIGALFYVTILATVGSIIGSSRGTRLEGHTTKVQ